MFFRLLSGIHTEFGKKYQVIVTKNEQGKVTNISQPVVESKVDLVQKLGPEKFQRLTDKEAAFLLQESVVDEPGSTNPVPTTPAESEVSKVAKEGAKDVLEPLGKDVTDKHPGAYDAGLRIFRKTKDAYLVTLAKNDELITAAGPITKDELKKLIKQYSD
jgi:hypothetical protein